MTEAEYDAAETAYAESRSLVAAEAEGDERAVEAALRPRSLDEVIGQERVREQLSLVLQAARGRQRPPDHVLLAGPPGLGKTTLAMIISAEMSSPLRLTSGPAITHAGDLAAILSSTKRTSFSFIPDKIAARSTACPGPPRRCSTWRWRTSGSTSSSARARVRPPSGGFGCPLSPTLTGEGVDRRTAANQPLHMRPGGALEIVMKVRNSLKSLRGRHRNNRLVRRKGRVYVINKTQKRFKARQG